jgi:hypothetical protein
MWRWIIRVYVAFMLFVVLVFMAGIAVVSVERSVVRLGYSGLSRVVHEYPLLTLFLIGLVVGQIYLGSNITGRGWFRSKSGLTYEGFRLEKLKPWSWLIVSPVLIAGIFLWLTLQAERGASSDIRLSSFYHGFLMSDCSNFRGARIHGDPECSLRLMMLGTWVAAVGYSLAPFVRRSRQGLYRCLANHVGSVSAEKRAKASMNAKAEKE